MSRRRIDRILLDTHAMLWWQAESQMLSLSALETIEQADRVFVSPISLWETGMLVSKGRLRLDRPIRSWVNDLLSSLELAELSATIATDAGLLEDFHGDPADRLIYSTARQMVLPLVTKDRRIADYAVERGDVRIVW